MSGEFWVSVRLGFQQWLGEQSSDFKRPAFIWAACSSRPYCTTLQRFLGIGWCGSGGCSMLFDAGQRCDTTKEVKAVGNLAGAEDGLSNPSGRKKHWDSPAPKKLFIVHS